MNISCSSIVTACCLLIHLRSPSSPAIHLHWSTNLLSILLFFYVCRLLFHSSFSPPAYSHFSIYLFFYPTSSHAFVRAKATALLPRPTSVPSSFLPPSLPPSFYSIQYTAGPVGKGNDCSSQNALIRFRSARLGIKVRAIGWLVKGEVMGCPFLSRVSIHSSIAARS